MTPTHRKNGEFRKGHAIRQKGDRPADGHLHVRVPMETKGRWVATSRGAGLPLSEWVTRTLDKEVAAVAIATSLPAREDPPAGFKILFGELPRPGRKTVTVEILGGPHDHAEFGIVPREDGLRQLVLSADSAYRLARYLVNVDGEQFAEYVFFQGLASGGPEK